jgi:hypothetical protein
LAFHDQQASMVEYLFCFFFGAFMLKAESAGGAKT